MPITGKTAKECFNVFSSHISKLIANVLPSKCQVRIRKVNADRAVLEYLKADGSLVPLKTKFGTIYFSAWQFLQTSKQTNRKYQLKTVQYSYRIQNTSNAQGCDAVLRWEYEPKSNDQHCRHHFHASTKVALAEDFLDLNKCHLPNGWIMIEEVLRFLIVELGVKPPCKDNWGEILANSEKDFYESFTSKRYKLDVK